MPGVRVNEDTNLAFRAVCLQGFRLLYSQLRARRCSAMLSGDGVKRGHDSASGSNNGRSLVSVAHLKVTFFACKPGTLAAHVCRGYWCRVLRDALRVGNLRLPEALLGVAATPDAQRKSFCG
jgi:hypothetical protein